MSQRLRKMEKDESLDRPGLKNGKSSPPPSTPSLLNNSHPPPPLVKKESLKKQLSFDEKVTEIFTRGRENSSDSNMSTEDKKPKRRRRKTLKWWEPSEKNTFAYFCRTTSIHGLQYLGNGGMHLAERVLWTVIFMASAITSIWLISALFVKYRDSPVVVTFDSSEMFIGEVPFPAVTICNMNRVLKSKATEYMRLANSTDDQNEEVRKAREDVYYTDHVCSVSNKPFSKMFNYSRMRGSVPPDLLEKIVTNLGEKDIGDVQKFLQKASQPCSEMIKLCMWAGEVVNCKDIFKPIETNFGKCCVFNMVPHNLLHTFTIDNRESNSFIKKWTSIENLRNIFGDSNKKFPKHQRRAGKQSGLMLLADPGLDEYFCTNSDSTGFRLSVHYTTDIPHVTDFGLAIRPNYEHFVSVTPDVVVADQVIRSYSIDKRKCYFQGEYKLKYYNLYTSSNCLDECIAEMTYNECKCVRYYMPRDDTRDICSPANFSCAENVRLKLMKSGLKSMCQECLPTCTEVKYSAKSTLAPLQRVDLWVDDATNQQAPWAKKNVSIIYVYFGEDSTYPKLRGQLYGITDLIANTGGLLGLCMGFSLLSFFEIIFHFTFRPWCRRQKRRLDGYFSPRHSLETSEPIKIGNGNGQSQGHINKAFTSHLPEQIESRRVHMKPGDDGLYHLENKNCSKPALPLNSNSNNSPSLHLRMNTPLFSSDSEIFNACQKESPRSRHQQHHPTIQETDAEDSKL